MLFWLSVFVQVLVLLDITPDEELLKEGLAREFVNRVQKLRKKAHLVPTDQVLIKVYIILSENYFSYRCDGIIFYWFLFQKIQKLFKTVGCVNY